MSTITLVPKNWSEFQHYKDREPTWIKLHRSLLNNYDFWRLPVDSRALAPMLWLLAAEYDGGRIVASLQEIAFRLHMSDGELAEALNPLMEVGFFTVASGSLAGCKQVSIPEKETEEETETEKEPPSLRSGGARAKADRGSRLPDDWMPDLADQTFAVEQGMTQKQAQAEFEKFRDYWHARAGPGGVKRDWSATWRNWCRKAMEGNPGHGGSRPRQGPGALASLARELADEARDRERAAGIGRAPDPLGSA